MGLARRRWPSGKLRLSNRRTPGSKPESTEDPPSMWACCAPYDAVWVKRLPAASALKFVEGMPLRCSPDQLTVVQNCEVHLIKSPHVSSKRDVNITKLSQWG
ncbi:hypothetical protein AVEN_228009-1 [Araneus ventricosus]|uniref:Uncharacterized protein n=1 Tax=Araneus ventricosus TaxID=182803 RepID=A0A4Y2NGF3_ARAVE|nr:hypothetical protein AVEN_228009-1 [Araneus ventricosus]